MSGAAAARICAVVVTHNRLAQLRHALAQLLAEPVDHVVVVDNASGDGTQSHLGALGDPRVTHLRLDTNLGGAGGFEAGMRHAVARHDPDWLLLHDDDAWPEPGAIAAFRAADTAGWDAVAAAVRTPDGAICEMNRPLLNPFRHSRVFWRTVLGGGRRAFHLDDAAFANPRPRAVDGGSFVGLFVARSAVALAGYPDGRLFVYADDGLYCLRLRKAGGRIAFMAGLRFTHDCASFTRTGALRPGWKVYFYHRNLLLLYREAAGPWFWPALLVILPRWARSAWMQGAGRRGHMRLLGWALRDGLTGNTDWQLPELRAAMRRHDL